MSSCSCDTYSDPSNKPMPMDQALKQLLDAANAVQEIETIDLLEARGRILAEDLTSTINVPGADNSAMDGYALYFEDTQDSDSTTLPISQRICAGQYGSKLEPKTAARIFTGAPIPEGANAVVMQELCTKGEGEVTINTRVDEQANIRKAGEDIAIGDTLLEAGVKLKPQDLGIIASVGIATVKVYRRLKVAVFFTGDELKEPGETLAPGQIYDSNRYTMRGLLESLNCEIIDLGIIEDTLDSTIKAMQSAAEQADLVMTSGGVSVGEEDYVRIALESIGKLNMWRINIKPGKPLAFGQIGKTPFLGMPGNPVSVFATFCLFARPYILKSQGILDTNAKSYFLPANFDWKKSGGRCEYIRTRAELNDAGVQEISHYANQGSGVLRSTSWANGLAVIQPNTTIEKGELIEFIPFTELSVF